MMTPLKERLKPDIVASPPLNEWQAYTVWKDVEFGETLSRISLIKRRLGTQMLPRLQP
jgi:hypothetical protein